MLNLDRINTLPTALLRRWLPLACSAALVACSGSGRVFRQPAPRAAYVEALRQTDLHETTLGRQWLAAGERALADTLRQKLPFRESAYFAAAAPTAFSYRFIARPGARLEVAITSETDAQLFADLFDLTESPSEPVFSADTAQSTWTYEPKQAGELLLRVQPELLGEGRFTVVVRRRPSLTTFPVEGHNSDAIRSFFRAARDGGRRRHEGVDIFAARGTPAVAAAKGVIRSTRDNRLGGKVVWLFDPARRLSLYYAHLDSQAVRAGQYVAVGDTVGFVGNTGNARTTPPHLHFGVYRLGAGAVDPLPFVRKPDVPPALPTDLAQRTGPLRVRVARANLRLRPDTRAAVLTQLPRHTLLAARSGTGAWLRVALPDSTQGYLYASLAAPLDASIAEPLAGPVPLRAAYPPGSVVADSAARVARMLAYFGGYAYVESVTGQRGWVD